MKREAALALQITQKVFAGHIAKMGTLTAELTGHMERIRANMLLYRADLAKLKILERHLSLIELLQSSASGEARSIMERNPLLNAATQAGLEAAGSLMDELIQLNEDLHAGRTTEITKKYAGIINESLRAALGRAEDTEL